MEESAEERERLAALASFKERSAPPRRPRSSGDGDPAALLVAGVAAWVVLSLLTIPLVGSDHVALAVVLQVLRAIAGLGALVGAVTLAVEWGIRRSRSDRP